MANKTKWTPVMEDLLVELRSKNRPVREIANALGVSSTACYNKLQYMGLLKCRTNTQRTTPAHLSVKSPTSDNRARAKRRPCLCCRDPFLSAGPHNRLCTKCRGQNDTPFDIPVRIGR
jgi:hypothetical protein